MTALTDECEVLWSSAPGSPGCCCGTSSARPASPMFASARRAATSAAPGTGTGTPASPATSSRTATCPCWRRWSTIPTMKFASGFEILEYCQTMAERFGFYDHCLFHTTVERTDLGRGDRSLDGVHRPGRRHAGPLRDTGQRHPDQSPSWRASRACRSSPGESFHTSRWRLRHRPRRASGSASSAPGQLRCRSFPKSPKWWVSCTYSSARLRPSTSATSGPDHRRRRSSSWQPRAGLGAGPGASPFRQASRQGARPFKANDDYLAGKVDGLQGAEGSTIEELLA